MSTPREYVVIENTEVEPAAFRLRDQHGKVIGEFRYSQRPRLDLVQAMADAVQLNGEGYKVYNLDVIRKVISEMLVNEVWIPPANDGEEGKWVPADDKQRFESVLDTDRFTVRLQVLGEIAADMVQETTGHPTGGSSPSSPGPEGTSPSSTAGGAWPESIGVDGWPTVQAGSTPST